MSEDFTPVEKVEPPCQILYLQSSSGKVYRCYRTSEADKVIAELKADYKEACGRLQTANLIKDEQLAATRHQKYKRCLAMAWWCESEAYIHEHGSDYDEDLVAWFGKWYKRWFKLAKKFKEVK